MLLIDHFWLCGPLLDRYFNTSLFNWYSVFLITRHLPSFNSTLKTLTDASTKTLFKIISTILWTLAKRFWPKIRTIPYWMKSIVSLWRLTHQLISYTTCLTNLKGCLICLESAADMEPTFCHVRRFHGYIARSHQIIPWLLIMLWRIIGTLSAVEHCDVRRSAGFKIT